MCEGSRAVGRPPQRLSVMDQLIAPPRAAESVERGGYRTIEVKPPGEGAIVQARRGYFGS